MLDSELVTVEGSFRNLVAVGSDSDTDSVSVFVFHSDQLLFTKDGSDVGGSDGDPKILSEADGSFAIERLSVAVGDTIDLVVGPNALNFFSDETAVRARIVPEPSADALAAFAFGTLCMIARRRARAAR